MSEGSSFCKVQLTLAQKDINIRNLERKLGLNTFFFNKETHTSNEYIYLQAQKGQVIRHNDALVGLGGSPGTFQNSTWKYLV